MSRSADTAESELEFSSIDEYDSLDELDQESQTRFTTGQAAKNYWLGKKFMDFALTYSILRDASPDETFIDVDASHEQVKVAESTRKWPYTPALGSMVQAFETSIPPGLRTNTGDDYESFMCALGYVLMRAPEPNNPAVSMLLESLSAGGDNFVKLVGSKADLDIEFRTFGTPGRDKGVEAKGVDYYRELTMFIEQEGGVIKRSTTKINDKLAKGRRWMTTLQTLNREFSGKGNTMHEATQKAAQRACETFGLGDEEQK
ncbi:hypothetical protein M409DRAFT_54143 [Zasmidium cellare ATCC 36951]|uniref:Uncharacterized protein n=1 Tax=Zasmidium cellare ATCC 36951 TaxID=1080233 RepID=A0A6A6CQ02_ZASCE|nr:uncharacterized protein M409DRAFT_54143 [Zasmidium cellare ATCC 36951]KAF2167546.1 hypothetical protein M409DRAFT_54143 [Zasmidium cellare ATCC 36951]